MKSGRIPSQTTTTTCSALPFAIAAGGEISTLKTTAEITTQRLVFKLSSHLVGIVEKLPVHSLGRTQPVILRTRPDADRHHVLAALDGRSQPDVLPVGRVERVGGLELEARTCRPGNANAAGLSSD